MYVPTGLKTVDGKDIMGFNGAFYLQNKEKINKYINGIGIPIRIDSISSDFCLCFQTSCLWKSGSIINSFRFRQSVCKCIILY